MENTAEPADPRFSSLHELLGEQERQRAALHLRVHDLELFRSECIETFKALTEMLDSARGRSAALEAVIPALLSSASPAARAQAQSDLELRWRQDQRAATAVTHRYASAFATTAREVVPQAAVHP